MSLYESFCGLLMGGRQSDTTEVPRTREKAVCAAPEPSQVQLLIISRDAESFYHSLTDEDFVGWLRGWSTSAQVLTPEDREFLLRRAQAQSLAPGP